MFSRPWSRLLEICVLKTLVVLNSSNALPRPLIQSCRSELPQNLKTTTVIHQNGKQIEGEMTLGKKTYN
eukprot:1496424-Amphidinium_carterae.1